jgi:hypothetical protein
MIRPRTVSTGSLALDGPGLFLVGIFGYAVAMLIAHWALW